MLALAAAKVPIPPAAATALTQRQSSDGSWSFSGSTEPGQGDSNTTAIVVQALVAVGSANADAIGKALDYLRNVRMADGSYAYQPEGPSSPAGDANSTALVMQALIAAGHTADAGDALAHFQNSDGAFRYRDDSPADSLLATVQAIPALMAKPLPIAPSGAGPAYPPALLPAAGGASRVPAVPVCLAVIGLGLLLLGAGLRRERPLSPWRTEQCTWWSRTSAAGARRTGCFGC